MVRNTLRRKLFRDMWQNRMQFVAMILLCALGSFAFSGLDASWRMIELSGNTYFDGQEMADIWVTLPAADREALSRVRSIPGVRTVQARATAELEVDLPSEATLVVEAYDGRMRMNLPLLEAGQMLDANDLRGCLLDQEFARANGLAVGDRLNLKLGSETYGFVIRGTCLEPEFVALSKHTVPDPYTYGFVLLNSRGLPALPLNNLVIRLEEGADGAEVERRITALYPEALILDRSVHSASSGVDRDVEMFRNLSYLFPLLAFGVAAMIVLTTITRMLENQRTQMGTLKALGFGDAQMLRHYMSYAFYPSLAGSLLGLAVGRCTLPYILWALEDAQFNMPYCLQAPISAAQWAVCALGVVLACLICLHTYRKSAREETAQLLRPKPPKAGRKLLLERIGPVWRRLGFNGKMVVRNLFRNKLRMMMSLIGVLCCTMLIITAMGLQDSVIYFVNKYYQGTLQYSVRANLTGTVDEVEAYRGRIECERLEGVMDISLTVRTRDQGRATLLTVLEDGQQLLYLGEDETWTPLPEEGVMLTQKLAEVMEVGIGDSIALWLPGDDEPVWVTVRAISPITLGQTVMMGRAAWERCQKGGFMPTALLVDGPTERGMRALSDLDGLDELLYPEEEAKDTLKILDSLSQIFLILSVVALGLAFVVLYNMGILNYMERYREYATLKVLGYHQKEIRRLMSSENSLLTLIGIALGIGPGRWLTGAVMNSCETDSMIFVSTVNWDSFAIACVVTYVFSWVITRFLTRKVRSVDMVEALKSVE